MGRTQTNIYQKLLEFQSVRQYLTQSIGAKKSKINPNASFEELIDSVDVSQYLRGLVIFLDYFQYASNPYELIQYIENIYRSNDKQAKSEFVQCIDNFVSWLKAKGYSDKTVLKYQAHVRAFIHKNHFSFSFKNWDADSERQIENEKKGIDIGLIKEILWKIPEYTNDYYLKMLVEGMQKTGLGSAEIRSLTFGDLRYRFKNNGNGDEEKFVAIEKRREKSNVPFLTYLYGDYKRKVIKHLEMHPKSEYSDKQSWLLKTYNQFDKLFSTAYKNLIEKEYPEFRDEKRKIATLHWYRHVFCASAEIVGCPKVLIDRFVGHKGDSIQNIYHNIPKKKALEYFKKIQEELFGIRESDTREQIEKQIMDRLMENLLNKGKRQTIFDAIDEHPEHLKNETTDRKMGYFIEKILKTAEENAVKRLKNDEEFIDDLFNRFETKLLNRYRLMLKSWKKEVFDEFEDTIKNLK